MLWKRDYGILKALIIGIRRRSRDGGLSRLVLATLLSSTMTRRCSNIVAWCSVFTILTCMSRASSWSLRRSGSSLPITEELFCYRLSGKVLRTKYTSVCIFPDHAFLNSLSCACSGATLQHLWNCMVIHWIYFGYSSTLCVYYITSHPPLTSRYQHILSDMWSSSPLIHFAITYGIQWLQLVDDTCHQVSNFGTIPNYIDRYWRGFN
jgi:hypothetical protein